MEYNFEIRSSGQISQEFKRRNIFNFVEAQNFLKQLPYKRNKNKKDLKTVFTDGHGTCSSKHALLKQLAIEHGEEVVKLKLGIFKMNSKNSPKVTLVLNQYRLDYIPEAHCYLEIDGEIVDLTGTGFDGSFVRDITEEIEIGPDQITAFKVEYHLDFLKKWLLQHPEINHSVKALFDIREMCIVALERN